MYRRRLAISIYIYKYYIYTYTYIHNFARENFGYEMTVLGTKPDFRPIFKKTLEMDIAGPK